MAARAEAAREAEAGTPHRDGDGEFLRRPARPRDPRTAPRPQPVQGSVDLPDAPGGRARRPGRLPDLRHGARAARVPSAEEEREPRAARHDAPVLGRASRSRVPVFALAMGEMIPGNPLAHALSPRAARLDPARCSRRRSCSGAAGRSSCAAGRRSSSRHLNMFTLIALGTGAAYALQRRRDAVPGRRSRRRSAARTARVAVYFEAAAVIVTLVLLGQVLELRARSRTGAAIRALLGLAPKTARRIARRRRRSATCRSTQVAVGDRLRVRPGREGPGRRRRARGRERGRRVDDHRRADAGREASRRRGRSAAR